MSALEDLKFVLHDVLELEAHCASLNLPEPLDRAFIDAVMDEAFKFCRNELQPLRRSGDEIGCTLEDGVVTTPPGFKEAYAKYIEGGWPGLMGDPRFGGQGLPAVFGLMLEEQLATCNPAWAMCPGLSRGAMEAINAHGSEEQKATFLPKLLSGEWTGTMCLTEPHAGSDVGLARTKAEPQADGSYAVTGTKIFISSGEHDMSENIVHLVLARLPEAPAGTRGISMFVVPKFDLDGTRNQLVCSNIEEKMGIHANPTCVLNFEGARGYLVGEENKGMRYMFTMMNAARIAVGLQGVCAAQGAFEVASAYAHERLQMRSLSGPKAPDQPADPIIVHPDVRRMLLAQRSFIEAGRGLAFFTAMVGDVAEQGSDPEAAARADALLDFLTPITKGFLTEIGIESVKDAIQVFGGHGFIRETGVEQFSRDVRITSIYEGTTGIQGLDLLGRKVLQTQGKGLLLLLEDMKAVAAQCDGDLAGFADALNAHADEWGELSLSIGGKAASNPDEVGAAAVDYLYYGGYVALTFIWAKMALAARAALAAGDTRTDFLQSKLDIANFWLARMLPKAQAHKAAILAGGESLMDVNEQAFVA